MAAALGGTDCGPPTTGPPFDELGEGEASLNAASLMKFGFTAIVGVDWAPGVLGPLLSEFTETADGGIAGATALFAAPQFATPLFPPPPPPPPTPPGSRTGGGI